MKRIFAPLAAATLALAPLAAAADMVPLSEISTYLNGLKTAKAGFKQHNSDGSVSTGTLFIKRPGRVRFEYAPPDQTLVLASGGQVAVFDPKSNQPPERFPLAKTPLSLILAREVDLGRAKMVVGHAESGPYTVVTAQDPENPDYGTIQLAFTADPVALREWVIDDNAGNVTRVVLGDMAIGGAIRDREFNILSEMTDRGFSN